ncbi:hypothetical protein V6N13_113506 [Hibiscus sabdariffa]
MSSPSSNSRSETFLVVVRPLFSLQVTAYNERLEFTKVCVEVKAGVPIPQTIDIIFKDGSSITVKSYDPWLLSSCGNCKLYGHTEKTCVANTKTKCLTISQQKKSTSKEKPKKMISGSITGVDDTRKPRVASMGVVALL